MGIYRGLKAAPLRERGQGLVEYALILVLIAVVVIIILTLLGTQVNFIFARIAVSMDPEYSGLFNGPSLTLAPGTVSITPDGWGGSVVNVSGYQTVTVCVSASGSGGSELVCGAPPSTSSAVTSACVVAVEGHNLTSPVCTP